MMLLGLAAILVTLSSQVEGGHTCLKMLVSKQRLVSQGKRI